VEEEVAAVEVDEVDHRGPVKIGGFLWVVSHSCKDRMAECMVSLNFKLL
jgi:hypothetical protein